LLISFQIISSLAFCQIDSSSIKIVESILRKEHPEGTLYYTDKLDSGLIVRIKGSLQKRKFIGRINSTTYGKIRLSRKEKRYLDSNINKLYSIRWKDSLFENSRMIPNDSMWAHIDRRNREFSKFARVATTEAINLVNNRVTFCNTFQFSCPIYFRDRSIFIVFFIRLCGNECGVEELAFYRLEEDMYKKWFIVYGGVF
jgi:hypothetical protein